MAFFLVLNEFSSRWLNNFGHHYMSSRYLFTARKLIRLTATVNFLVLIMANFLTIDHDLSLIFYSVYTA